MRGRKTGGRQKGTPNKITRDVREAVVEAFYRAGGADYLLTLSKENPNAFTALLGRVLPKDVKVEGDTEVTIRWGVPGKGDAVPE